MGDERILGIIQTLEHVRERPAMYTRGNTASVIGTYLTGFHTACHILGLSVSHELRRDVTEERGWPRSAEIWSVSDMRQRGLSEEAIADEMLAIEITAWQRMYEMVTD